MAVQSSTPGGDYLIISYQGQALCLTQTGASAEKAEFDYESASDHVAVERVDQADRGLGGAAGRQQVVDNQHAAVSGDRVLMDFQRIDAVFQLILLLDPQIGKLAGLARDNHP